MNDLSCLNWYTQVLRMIIRVRICQWLAMIYWSLDMPKSCEWLIGQYRYAQSLADDWLCFDLSKSCKWLIGVRTCQCLANDLLEFWYAQVLRMIDRSLHILWFRDWLVRVLKYHEATGTCSNISLFLSFFSHLYMIIQLLVAIFLFSHHFFTLMYDYTIIV